MARPARVDILCLKPWFLARLCVLGWYVRFNFLSSLLEAGAASGVGGIGFSKTVEDVDYFLHILILSRLRRKL